MKKIFLHLIMIFTLSSVTFSCQEKKSNINKENIRKMNKNESLKDGINLPNSFIQDIKFNTYKYEGHFIEEIKLDQLLNQSYRKKLFDYLSQRNFDGGQYEQVFFIKLLLIRIQQTNDIALYSILNDTFLDSRLGYYLEDYEMYLFQLFLYKPDFFLRGSILNHNTQLLDYINQSLPLAILTNKEYFDNNIVDIQYQENNLLLEKDIVDKFSLIELKKQLENKADIIEATFSPSFDTEWKNKISFYYNIYNYLDLKIKNSLNKNEIIFYDVKYRPFFKNYIIKGEPESIYTIQDPDGFTNLRKDKSTSSEVLQRIKSGEHIEVLDNSEDWFLVKTSEGKQGYVHKSRVKEQ